MIKIFNENDRDFNTNGNIVIKPIKCKEVKKKSLNGWYVEVEVSVKYKEYIEQDKLCVVKTKSKIRPQAFRIENPKVTNNVISFTANHVMFDSKKYFLVDVRPTNQNGQNALSYINERTDKKSPFTIFSNVGTESTAYFIRKNLLEAWEVIEERWNGVFDADNWDISFLSKVGNDNGETISYGKNMQGIQILEDWSNVCTRIYPVGPDELMLDEKYLESDIQYPTPYTRTITFNSELEQNEEETEEEKNAKLIEELRKNAEKYLEESKYPKVSYEVTSNINQNMEIGDIIHVKHPLVNLITEVLEYEHNILTGKIELLVFGNYKRDVKSKFDGIKDSINNVADQLTEGLTRQDIVIKQQTDLINSLNKTGYVYIDKNEILILDALPRENAKNVWRFGLGGIGFSSNGYEGPFKLAMTMDGQINADFITTGTMSVARIEGLQNTLNDYLVSIQLNSTNIQQMVATQNEIVDKFGNYSTTEEMNSLIDQRANSITSSVISSVTSSMNDKLKNYYTISQTDSKISQTASSITTEVNKKVNNSEFGTKIQQSYSDIQIAWNKISNYIQFINAQLQIKDSSSNLLMALTQYGLRLYESGTLIGNIGTNSLTNYSNIKGLVFDLDAGGNYMTWASRTGTSGNYIVKLTYAKAGTPTFSSSEGLHLGANIYMNSYRLVYGDNDEILKYSGGIGVKFKEVFYVTNSSNNEIMAFAEANIYAHRDLDMGGCSIVDCANYASDGRLKKNIYTSKINAINRVKQIKHREFIWKENGLQEQIGYIAQELEEIDKNYVRHIIKENEDGVIKDKYEVRILPLVSTATKAIQEQQEIIEEQQEIMNKQQQFIEIIKEKLDLEKEYSAIFNDIRVQAMSTEVEKETIFEGDVVTKTERVLKPAPRYNKILKKLDDGQVEIYDELAKDSEV